MSADGNSYFESLWNATACMLCNVIDAYGWILPALILTALVLGVIALIGCLVDDIPVDLDLFGESATSSSGPAPSGGLRNLPVFCPMTAKGIRVELLFEVANASLEGILEILLEAVSNDAENLVCDLNAIRKGKRRPVWRIEKYVC